MQIAVDAVIFGGGAAGLWLLDLLRSRGHRVLLLEAGKLGQGQTISAQGIIHGGLKYTLQGLLTNSATAIREMPQVWRQSLQGMTTPNLNKTQVGSHHCYLWRTESVASRLGMIGARIGLRIAPTQLKPDERPEVLAHCPGTVARLDEQVISTESFLNNLAENNQQSILSSDTGCDITFQMSPTGDVQSIQLINQSEQEDSATGIHKLKIVPKQVIFTAGAGNAQLLKAVGRVAPKMQLRPLQMVMLRGKRLPKLNGHCVDGAKTRVTITSSIDTEQRIVWQVGGQLAEEGVQMDSLSLLKHAWRELLEVLPGLDLSQVEGATYRVDRAERLIPGGNRPDSVQITCDRNLIAAWPTKMALAPELANSIAEQIPQAESSSNWSDTEQEFLSQWKKPVVAEPPWECCDNWQNMSALEDAESISRDRVA